VTVKVIRNKIVEKIPRFPKISFNQVVEFTVWPLEGHNVESKPIRSKSITVLLALKKGDKNDTITPHCVPELRKNKHIKDLGF